jgi:hypothetical protein
MAQSKSNSATRLIHEADRHALGLLKSVNPDIAALDGNQAFDNRVDALIAVTKYLQTRHRIKPDEDEPSDFLSRARRELPPGASQPGPTPGARPASQRRARRQASPSTQPTVATSPEPASGADEGSGLQFGRAGVGPALGLPDDAPALSASPSPNGSSAPAAPEAGPEAFIS